MGSVLSYHNNFNKVQLSKLNEQELNLLFVILAQMRDKKVGEKIELFAKDINKIILELKSDDGEGKTQHRLQNSRKYLTDTIDSLKTKFFKLDFRQVLETETEIIDKTFNLFQTMEIHYVKRNPYDGNDYSKLFNRVVLTINPDLNFLIYDLKANFTTYELKEFLNIRGKYAKNLYRYLKQYRTTGWMQMDIKDFFYEMDIPKKYRQGNLDQRVINPAFKELKPIFKGLKSEKIKENGCVTAIKFTFDKQLPAKQIESQQSCAEEAEKINQQIKIVENSQQGHFNEKDRQEAFLFIQYKLKHKDTLLRIENENKEAEAKITKISFKTQKTDNNILLLESANFIFKTSTNEFEKEFKSAKQLKQYISNHAIKTDSNTKDKE